MRWRILAPMLALLVLAAALVVVPVLALVSEDRTRDLVASRSLALDRMAALARSAEDDDGGPDALQRYLDRHHALFGESAAVVDSSGRLVAGVGDPAFQAAVVRDRTTAYGYSVPQSEVATVLPWSGSTSLMSQPVEVDDIGGGAAVLQVDLAPARADVRATWALVVGSVLAVTAALVAGALVIVRWVLRPVADLDRAAHDLSGTSAAAEGLDPRADPQAFATTHGPPELRRLATAFWQMVAALTASLRQQSELLAHTSHNLRNPLAAVRLRVDLLVSTGSDDVREQLGGVQDDLDRLDDLVEGLLLLAQAEHEGARRQAAALGDGALPEPAVTVLDADDVARRWEDRAARCGASVTGLGEARAVAVAARSADVLLDSLVDNALKYGGPGVAVQVGVSGDGDVVVAVDDDGPGLSAQDRERASDRFWRAPQHAEHQGTGLGLAIVRTLAEAHGGSVELGESSRGGLRVVVRLPQAVAVLPRTAAALGEAP